MKQMKRCKECGELLKYNAIICNNCGFPVEYDNPRKLKLNKKIVIYVGIIVVAIIMFLSLLQTYIVANSKSSSSKSGNNNYVSSNVKSYSSKSIDWNKCISDTKADVLDTAFFSYAKDVSIIVDESDKRITISAVVGDATNDSTALEYANTIIRKLNLYAKAQDSSIKSSGTDYYGGIYDKYDLIIGVSRLSDVNNSSNWIIYDAVSAGLHQSIDLQ